jgi:hypothetical protein
LIAQIVRFRKSEFQSTAAVACSAASLEPASDEAASTFFNSGSPSESSLSASRLTDRRSQGWFSGRVRK